MNCSMRTSVIMHPRRTLIVGIPTYLSVVLFSLDMRFSLAIEEIA